MKKTFVKILKILGAAIGVCVLAVLLLFGFLSLTEYKPAEEEPIVITGSAPKSLKSGETVKVMSWNIGYGALGDNADFFMDGGKGVKTATKERVNQNLNDIITMIRENHPDLLLIQEADVSSSRSYKIDETARILEGLSDDLSGSKGTPTYESSDYEATFANNLKVAFLPYPIPPIGKVDSGLFTLSSYPIESATRVQLPIPFAWPVRMANLKRCLSVHRIPVEDSDEELVLVNLHLEAYDSGEGKIAQTKMLKKLLEEEAEKGNYVIAAGDFNQTFSNVDSSMYPMREDVWQCGSIDVSEFDDSLIFLMDNTSPTCRSLDQPYAGYDSSQGDFQYYMIDGMIVSDNVEVKSFETIDLNFAASDHNPILAEVVLK